MAIPISVPPLGWSSDDALFAGWLKADGDEIRPGEAVFSLESEKATQEVESLDGGILRIPPSGPKPGDRLAVGTVIGYLVTKDEAAPFQNGAHAAQAAATNGGAASSPKAGPAARRLARELDVNVQQVAGTGKSGVITTDDIRRHKQKQKVATAPRSKHRPNISPRARRAAEKLGINWTKLEGGGTSGRIRERDVLAVAGTQTVRDIVPLTPMRRTIAARMVESSQTTAPVTLTTTTEATNLVNLRRQFQEATPNEAIPSFTDFLVKLTALALKDHPHLNARWENDGIVLQPEIHIGIAVDTEAGLLAPVIRDVPALGMRALAARSRELIEKARQRKLIIEEMQGGTFTITNLGAFGIDGFTPVINLPEAAILGIGRIRREPVVRGDDIVIQDVVTLSLTFDHRIVDGAPAARFLQRLCELVRNPGAWLMG
jgi:pyruvate dehydrogenase E2 component (dihydrolipoamide acetyltransferase)